MSDADKVLTKAARPAWQLYVFVTVIVVMVAQFIEWDTRHARAAAQEVVSPLEKTLIEMNGNIRALCQATGATCPNK